MTEEEWRSPFNQPCWYCGEITTGKSLHRDHFHPRHLGGEDSLDNLVYACNTCNVIKGRRSFESARLDLLQKKLKWPRLSVIQIEWLRGRGLDLTELDSGKLYFETIRD